MDENTTGDVDGLDRRSMIKKVGVAGAAAWTAPVLLDSVLSPASAASAGGGGGTCSPFTPYTEDFSSVPNTGGAPGFDPPQDFQTYNNGAELGTTPWQVVGGAGANVDAVTLPGPYSTGFAGSGSLIDLGGTDSTRNSGIRAQFNMGCADDHVFEFDWKNQSAANAVLTISGGFGSVSFTLTTGTPPTANQTVLFTTTTDNDVVTIRFLQGDHTNTGAFVGNFSLT